MFNSVRDYAEVQPAKSKASHQTTKTSAVSKLFFDDWIAYKRVWSERPQSRFRTAGMRLFWLWIVSPIANFDRGSLHLDPRPPPPPWRQLEQRDPAKWLQQENSRREMRLLIAIHNPIKVSASPQCGCPIVIHILLLWKPRYGVNNGNYEVSTGYRSIESGENLSGPSPARFLTGSKHSYRPNIPSVCGRMIKLLE